MILKEEDFVIEKKGIKSEYEFSIDENDFGIIIDILRSKIYSNPIASICREIISNARDSHIEANKNDIPIQISIFRRLNNGYSKSNNGGLIINEIIKNSSYIEFKDFGVGISQDRIQNIYCKYASSSKRTDNNQTGGFGLGAKTPFSYSDTFIIKTVFSNIEYIYIAYIDESKKGKISLIQKTETELENETSIIIPIKDSDIYIFENYCIYYTILWKVKPTFISFENLNKLEFEYKRNSNNCDIIYSNTQLFDRTKIYISIDGIPYPIDSSIKELQDFKMNNYYSNNGYYCNVFLKFNIGELDISANRENIHYTKDTINKIQSKLISITDLIKKEFDIEYSKQNNIVDKNSYIQKYVRPIDYSIHYILNKLYYISTLQNLYHNLNYKESHYFHDIFIYCLEKRSDKSIGSVDFSKHKVDHINFHDIKNRKFIKCTKINYKKLHTYFLQNNIKNDYVYIAILNNSKPKIYNDKHSDKYTDIFDVIKVDDLDSIKVDEKFINKQSRIISSDNHFKFKVYDFEQNISTQASILEYKDGLIYKSNKQYKLNNKYFLYVENTDQYTEFINNNLEIFLDFNLVKSIQVLCIKEKYINTLNNIIPIYNINNIKELINYSKININCFIYKTIIEFRKYNINRNTWGSNFWKKINIPKLIQIQNLLDLLIKYHNYNFDNEYKINCVIDKFKYNEFDVYIKELKNIFDEYPLLYNMIERNCNENTLNKYIELENNYKQLLNK